MDETLRFASRISFTWTELGQRYPREPVPPRQDRRPASARPDQGGTEMALSRRTCRFKWLRLAEKGLLLHRRQQESPITFLTVHDIVQFARKPGHPVPGARLGRQFGGLLCPGHHLGRSDADRSAVRALRQHRTQANRPTSTWISSMSGARRSSSISTSATAIDRAALTATVIHYRPRSAIREVGKVFGLTEGRHRQAGRTAVWGRHGD